MRKFAVIALTTTALTLSAHSVQADQRGLQGFVKLLGAVAQAADENRRRGYAPQVAGYQANQSQQSYGHEAYSQQDYGPTIYDISGSWQMSGGRVNRFQRTHQGYYVAPVGRGKGVHYVEIGDNLYQDANSSGTYEVVNERYMVWSSNDRRNKVIELYR